eukprot:m.241058 g.241058  ORF g.241058 m.241058 type:complete len:96 (-) comp16085_c0_seq14:330-617(-)
MFVSALPIGEDTERGLQFKFYYPPASSVVYERAGFHRDPFTFRYVDGQGDLRRCYRCHRYSLNTTDTSSEFVALMESMWAPVCVCGGYMYHFIAT